MLIYYSYIKKAYLKITSLIMVAKAKMKMSKRYNILFLVKHCTNFYKRRDENINFFNGIVHTK